MIYFAYGSNLDPVQWAARCPASPPVAVARLDHHRLHFPRRSPVRLCAVASIEPAHGETVWGALYRMSAEDLAALDAREGHFPDRRHESRYLRTTITVSRVDDSDGRSANLCGDSLARSRAAVRGLCETSDRRRHPSRLSGGLCRHAEVAADGGRREFARATGCWSSSAGAWRRVAARGQPRGGTDDRHQFSVGDADRQCPRIAA